jgi:hypothetical protein
VSRRRRGLSPTAATIEPMVISAHCFLFVQTLAVAILFFWRFARRRMAGRESENRTSFLTTERKETKGSTVLQYVPVK